MKYLISSCLAILSVCNFIAVKADETVTTQERIFLNAEANVNDSHWALETDRQAKRKSTVFYPTGEWKSNLFVYEIILASGYDVGTPKKVSKDKAPQLVSEKKDERPPCTSDWYNNGVPGFNFIGEGDSGKAKSIQGDIITDGCHIGIVAGNGKTFSAGKKEIELSDWGFKGNERKPVRIFRIDPSKTNGTATANNKKTRSNGNDECDSCDYDIDNITAENNANNANNANANNANANNANANANNANANNANNANANANTSAENNTGNTGNSNTAAQNNNDNAAKPSTTGSASAQTDGANQEKVIPTILLLFLVFIMARLY